MAEITLTLRDTPEGGVSVRSQYAPAVGAHPTAAQKLAMDLHSQAVRRAMAPTLVDVAPQPTEGNAP